jgi:hypothetical protein
VSSKVREWNNNLPVDENGNLHIYFGEFGWGPDVLNDPLDKISYYITDKMHYIYDDSKTYDEIIYEFKKKSEIQELIKIIKEQCLNVKDIIFEPVPNKVSLIGKFGYIDHDSCGLTEEITDLRNYIFNSSVYVVIDNDNSCNFEEINPETFL